MASVQHFLDEQLAFGRAYFSKRTAEAALGIGAQAFLAAAARLVKKRRLANPKRGFYLILRAEDRISGAPDPAAWIDPLMCHLGLDYRVSLLRAAAFHGASHQAAMVFQVIVPQQMRRFEIGRHRLQFIYQNPADFARLNRRAWLAAIKTPAGFAKVANIEMTLLDVVRYFRQSTGINGVAQIVYDLGRKANPSLLAKLARYYANTSVRRLGYLLELFDYTRQANALLPQAGQAKSFKPLNPAIKPIAHLSTHEQPVAKWMLCVNQSIEIDC